MQKNAKKKQLKIEIKILDKNLTACLMSRPAKTRILNPAIVLQGSRCLQIGLHSSKIRGAAGCTPTLCFLIGLSRYVEVFETLLLRKKMSIKGPLKSLRKKSKGRKGWLRGKESPSSTLPQQHTESWGDGPGGDRSFYSKGWLWREAESYCSEAEVTKTS